MAGIARTGDRERAAELVGDQGVRIDPEEMEGSGEEIFGGDRRLSNFSTDFVALSDDTSASDATTREKPGIDLRPMFTAGTCHAGIDLGCSSMFADAEDECFVEHAALFEIFNQGRE